MRGVWREDEEEGACRGVDGKGLDRKLLQRVVGLGDARVAAVEATTKRTCECVSTGQKEEQVPRSGSAALEPDEEFLCGEALLGA